MIRVELESSFVVKGALLPLRVSHPDIHKFGQLQVEVYDAGVPNPSARLGFGAEPAKVGDNWGQVQIDSRHLDTGTYEVRLVRFHSPLVDDAERQINLVAQRDFPRLLFEVIAAGSKGRTATELATEVQARESALEREFLSPVEIFGSDTAERIDVMGLVFVRDVLVGTAIRLRNFELIPTGTGLDSKDSLEFVNAFLRDRTKIGVSFPYDSAAEHNSRSSAPVCVVHFPRIVASTHEQARDYCLSKVRVLLLALSLSRDAGGIVFELVLIDHADGAARKYSITSPYVGNLLTGHLSGESAQSLQTYLLGLERDAMSSFLVNLYKEARREQNPDYQYLRLWQILEVMAESRNYDPELTLLDYEGRAMMDGDRPRKCSGSVNTVFALLRDEGLGSTTDTWEKVNVWYAFRSAVAHHGSVARFDGLSRKTVKEWARRGLEQGSPTGHDKYLWALKEDAKLILMRRLVRFAEKNEEAST